MDACESKDLVAYFAPAPNSESAGAANPKAAEMCPNEPAICIKSGSLDASSAVIRLSTRKTLVSCLKFNRVLSKKSPVQIAAGTTQGLINSFDVAAERPLQTFNGHAAAAPVTCIDYSPNSEALLLSGAQDNLLVLFDARSSATAAAIAVPAWTHDCGFVSTAETDAGLFYSTHADNTVKLWDCRNHSTPLYTWSEEGRRTAEINTAGDRFAIRSMCCVNPSGDKIALIFSNVPTVYIHRLN